jgi:hypothetical protein
MGPAEEGGVRGRESVRVETSQFVVPQGDFSELHTTTKRLWNIIWTETETERRASEFRRQDVGHRPMSRLLESPRYSRFAHCPIDSGMVPVETETEAE